MNITNIDDDSTLLFDISGQARPSTVTSKDVGCDEYTTGTTTNHPLTLSEVGPSYLMALSANTFDLSDKKTSIFPNPVNDQATIRLDHFQQFGLNNLTVNVFDINGKLVYTETSLQRSIITLGTSVFAKGLYFVEVRDKSKRLAAQKMLVQ